jgi:hypothetical protein
MVARKRTFGSMNEMQEFFRQTGSLGGKKRMASLTAAQRKRLAKKAAAASAKVRSNKAKKKRKETK